MSTHDRKDLLHAHDLPPARTETPEQRDARKQRESDNLDQALQETSDCSDPISPFVPAVAPSFSSSESLPAESFGVDWDRAPKWANYWCWDEGGAHWYREAPEWVEGDALGEKYWRESGRGVRDAETQNFGANEVVAAPAETFGYAGPAPGSLVRRP